MADEMDVSGWYAPAMNIHRSAFSGRNFEYFSEDPVLSGKMAAQAVIGAKEHGVYSFIKHFAFNDQEMNRNDMLCTWSNEQALREIYLKPFEICVKEGGAGAVMSTFSYIGTIWGGTDICLSPMDNETNHLTDTTSATSVKAARQSCKNIMYTIVNSRAYDPENLDQGMAGWQKIAIGLDIILGLILAGVEVLIVREYLRKKKDVVVIIEDKKWIMSDRLIRRETKGLPPDCCLYVAGIFVSTVYV